jgi:acetolactate synthase-1/2/3 large subunit
VTSLSGHAGAHAVAVAQQYGVTTMFTLSGGHVFPLYDGAVKADPPMRLVDVRHEQTAVFAAEGTARLTRTPGLAVVTAGPGVTNSVSAVTGAWFNGAPLVVLGGRAPDYLWGRGALQEMDHVPLLAPVTKRAWTEHTVAGVAGSVDEAFRLALTPHRGPVFCDFPLEAIFGADTVDLPPDAGRLPAAAPPEADDVAAIATLLRAAQRPVLVLGSDVWLDGAETAARECAEALSLPVITNGQARGVLPRGHRCWSPGPDRSPWPRPTWSSWSACRSTSGSSTGRSAPRTPRPRSCTWPTPRPGSPPTSRWRPRPRAT